MRSVGIDIGSYSIKVAEVESTTHNYRVVDYIELPLTQDLSVDKKILIIDALRKVASHYRDRHVSFVMAVKQECVSVRYKSFPFKERHKIVKSLPFQLVDEVPFDHTDAVYEAKFVGSIGKITEVLAFICLKSHVKDILALATDAGIHPHIITAQGVAIANLLSIWNEPPPELMSSLYALDEDDLSALKPRDVKGVLEIGHSRTLFSTYVDKNLVQTRSLYFGGMHIIKKLAKKYEVSETEALKILKEKGFVLAPGTEEEATNDQRVFSDTIASCLTELIVPLKRTLFSLLNQQKMHFSQIYLLGGVSGLLNLDKYLSNKLDVPCQLFPSYSQSAHIPENTSAMAIGLAIEGLRRPRNPFVNFRKNELALQDKSFDKLWKAYGHTFKLAVATILVFFFYTMIRGNLTDELSLAGYDALTQQANSPGFNLKKATPVRIQKFIRDKRRDIKNKQDLVDMTKIPSALDTMARITRQFPKKNQGPVEVRRLLIQNDKVQVEGEMSDKRQKTIIENSLKTIAQKSRVFPIKHTFQHTPPEEGSQALTSKDLPFAYKLNITHKR